MKAWDWRGYTRHILGQLEHAESDFNRSLALNPTNAWTWFARAQVRRDMRRFEEAADDYAQSTKLDFKGLDSFAQLGICLTLLGEGTDARAALKHLAGNKHYRHEQHGVRDLEIAATLISVPA